MVIILIKGWSGMLLLDEWNLIVRVFLACILGGIIGLERESMDHPAGFRTHILVCIGSALIMLVSMYGFVGFDNPKDPGRIAAQVVSGIGFLGAGTIIHEGVTIRGLTTAASLWVVAGIGLAVGAGMYVSAVVSTLLVYVTLVLFKAIEFRVNKFNQHLKIVLSEHPGHLGQICLVIGKHNAHIKNIKIHNWRHESDRIEVNISLAVQDQDNLMLLIQELALLEGIYTVEKN